MHLLSGSAPVALSAAFEPRHDVVVAADAAACSAAPASCCLVSPGCGCAAAVALGSLSSSSRSKPFIAAFAFSCNHNGTSFGVALHDHIGVLLRASRMLGCMLKKIPFS
jgi:hypothetical protein